MPKVAEKPDYIKILWKISKNGLKPLSTQKQ